MADSLIGKTARVISPVSAEHMGEVMVDIRGGSETYYAYSYEPEKKFSPGTQVYVTDESPGRTVFVTQ